MHPLGYYEHLEVYIQSALQCVVHHFTNTKQFTVSTHMLVSFVRRFISEKEPGYEATHWQWSWVFLLQY